MQQWGVFAVFLRLPVCSAAFLQTQRGRKDTHVQKNTKKIHTVFEFMWNRAASLTTPHPTYSKLRSLCVFQRKRSSSEAVKQLCHGLCGFYLRCVLHDKPAVSADVPSPSSWQWRDGFIFAKGPGVPSAPSVILHSETVGETICFLQNCKMHSWHVVGGEDSETFPHSLPPKIWDTVKCKTQVKFLFIPFIYWLKMSTSHDTMSSLKKKSTPSLKSQPCRFIFYTQNSDNNKWQTINLIQREMCRKSVW